MNGGAFDRMGSSPFGRARRTDHQRDVGNVAHADVLIEHFVIDHRGHGRAFADGVASEFGVVIGTRGFDPWIDVERLILERVA